VEKKSCLLFIQSTKLLVCCARLANRLRKLPGESSNNPAAYAAGSPNAHWTTEEVADVSDALISLSTDHVAAFVELARHGSLRAAAGALHLTEQGPRNTLLVLESRLRITFYH